MRGPGTNRSVRGAVRVYSALAGLLPDRTRRRQLRATVAMFGRLAEEASAVSGSAGVARVFVRGVSDLLAVVVLEWLTVFAGGLITLRGLPTWLLHDMRQARRALLHRPSFLAAAVATLAIATGGGAAVFALIDATMLRPLPYRESGALYRLVTTYGGESGANRVSYPDFVDIRDQNRSFDELILYRNWIATLGGEDPVREYGQLVSAGFFQSLGIEPMLGRAFLEDEQRDGNDAVVVLSHGLWQRQFGGDASIVGQSIEVNGVSHRVVGVAPERFATGLPALGEVTLWRPLGYEGVAADRLPGRGTESFQAIARLRSDVTLERAHDDVARVMSEVERRHPDTNLGQSVILQPLQAHAVANVRSGLLLLFGAVGFVLAIAVLNVTNLMLERASDRRQELAVRAALGASRARLLSPLLGEAMLVSVPGGTLGLLLAVVGIRWMVANAGAAIPLATEARLDGRVLAFLFFIVAGATLVAGLIAGMYAMRSGVEGVLRESGRALTAGRARARLSSALVVTEVALSLVLVMGAGLFVKSFRTLLGVEPGFDANVITFRVDPPVASFDTREKVTAFYDRLLERVSALPGVERAATISSAPLSGAGDCGTLLAREDPDRFAGQDVCAQVRAISPGYLRAMRIPLEAGRAFDARDHADADNVVIINRTTANLLWPGEDPIGRHLGTGFPDQYHEVVGVVPDVKQYSLSEAALPQTYLPIAQWQIANRTVVVQATNRPAMLYSLLREAVRETDARVPVSDMQTMGDAVELSLAVQRFRTGLLAGLGAFALLLAMVGIFGILSYSVSLRRRELAIRKSVGAANASVLGLVVADGLRLTAVGLALGLAASLAMSRLIASQLFETAATDPAVFVTVPLVFLGVALLACLVPALRALRVEATTVLRE